MAANTHLLLHHGPLTEQMYPSITFVLAMAGEGFLSAYREEPDPFARAVLFEWANAALHMHALGRDQRAIDTAVDLSGLESTH